MPISSTTGGHVITTSSLPHITLNIICKPTYPLLLEGDNLNIKLIVITVKTQSSKTVVFPNTSGHMWMDPLTLVIFGGEFAFSDCSRNL